MTMILLVALTVSLAGGAGVTDARAETVASVCPAEDARLRARVVRLIRSPSAAPIRERDGWSGVQSENLRLLADSTDTAVCRWLHDSVAFDPDTPRVTAYFAADGFYFIATQRLRTVDSGTVLLGGWEPIIVFRADGTLVGSYAS